MKDADRLTLAGARDEVHRKTEEFVHISTVSRWCDPGLKLRDGTIVRLARRRMLGRLYIERSAVWAFLEAIQEVPA